LFHTDGSETFFETWTGWNLSWSAVTPGSEG